MALASSGSATVTGKTGADQALVATPLADVKALHIDYEHSVVRIDYGSPMRTLTVEGANLATITATVAGVIVVSS